MGLPIHLDSVVKRYTRRDGGSVTVLDGVSLQCAAGSATRVEGRSGTGKSTLLNVIAGVVVPDEGRVQVGQQRLSELGEAARDGFRARHVGYVFQTFNLLSPLSALENLLLPAALAGRGAQATVERARAALVELGLEAQLDQRPYELSVGQRQRVAVARALLQRPQVLLADEPTANLDRESSAQVSEALLRMQAAGSTLVIATHDPLMREAIEGAVFDVESGEVAS